jgi:hypothetical protein
LSCPGPVAFWRALCVLTPGTPRLCAAGWERAFFCSSDCFCKNWCALAACRVHSLPQSDCSSSCCLPLPSSSGCLGRVTEAGTWPPPLCLAGRIRAFTSSQRRRAALRCGTAIG